MESIQQVKVQIISAFVDHDKGGNPAGVVLNADQLTTEQKLKIASQVGLSETAFVSASAVADFKLDFFTPTRQIAHCGHATIATFSYLSQLGIVNTLSSSKETIDGTREILLQGDLAFMEQKAPVYRDVKDRRNDIVNSLGLHEGALLTDAPISIVNTGNSFAIIAVANETVLQSITPDFDQITQISDEFDLIGYYIFSKNTSAPERDATARMFAPRYGIEEEAGTGMAAGPLACYLYDYAGIKKKRFLIEQGHFMKTPSPSLILADLLFDKEKITKVMAGGKGIPMTSITIAI